MIKRLFAIILFAIIFSHAYLTITLAANIPIYLNGQQQDINALFDNGRTMLPIQSCAEMFGMSVDYHSKGAEIAIMSCNAERYELHIGSDEIICSNNSEVVAKMDRPPLVRNETVYLPISFLKDIFYIEVEWNSTDRAIYIIAEPLVIKNNSLLLYRGNDKTVDLQDLNINTIGNSAFWNKQINEIVLPDVLERIEFGAFYGNDFSSIIIPENVREIEDWAFCNCLSLRWSAEFAYILVRHFKALARLVILLTVEADVIVLRHLNVLCGAFVVAVADVVRAAVFAFSAGHLLSSFPQRGFSFFTFSL